MSGIDRLAKSIERRVSQAKQAQIRFVECVSVDWESKTMTAKGTADNVEYFDVVLGFGYADIKPVIGTTCLIGIIDGQEVVTFLINAEEVELVETRSENIVYNGGDNFGLVKVKELTDKLNTLENDINGLKKIFSAWKPPTAPTIDNGAALKSTITLWAGQSIKVTAQAEIENDKIKH